MTAMAPLTIGPTTPIVARAREIETATAALGEELGNVAPAGLWCVAHVGALFACGMSFSASRVIDLVEVARPVSISYYWDAFQVDADRQEPEDFEPPLIAAGRFSTIALRGTLPPVDWDG